MLSKERHRSIELRAPKIPQMLKQPTSGTLSPETTTTTSSGYSTGGSSVSTTIKPSSKKSVSSIAQKQTQQHNTKSKGLHNLLTKLKNLLLPSKQHSRNMRSTTSRQISSTNILRQYHQQSTIYDVLPSSLPTNNNVSLPFTYYHNSPIKQSRANFEKISAWLDHTEKMSKNEQDIQDLLFIDSSQQQSISSSSAEIDNQAITVAMKKTPINIKPPKRSSSLVTRITRPIIEQKSQRPVSPASSILTKGMAERITPPSTSSSSRRSTNHSSKSNRRRTLDFTRRQSTTNTTEQHSNKENLSKKSSGDIYQFSPLSSNSKTDILNPSSKHTATKKYYFHSNPTKKNEDLLNNSYGLTLLNHQQQQQQPLQSRHSTATVLMMSQVPNKSLQKSLTPRTSMPQKPTLDSLDDLLCDREVESYFYPTSPDSEHIYMNLENLSDSYPSSSSYIHGTLC